MHNDVQLRWIAEAEARSVLRFAEVQRGASEPPVSVTNTRIAPTWPMRLHRLTQSAVRTVAGMSSFPFKPTTDAAPRFRLSFRSSADTAFDRVLAAILITDIVASTRRAAEMGDRRWCALMERHDDMARRQIKNFGGRVIRNRGDGYLAIFASPAKAVRCAAAMTAAVAPLGISLRSGIHAGEIQLKRREINGIAVHVTARIAAAASPGEALVSKTVRDLVTGAELAFDYRGVHTLRGLPEEIQLYAVRTAGEAENASIIRLKDRMLA